MKHLIVTGLSIMLLFGSSNPASAQGRHGKEVAANQTVQNNISNNARSQLTPFRLVNLAYKGYLRNQGIPSYGAFISDYQQMSFRGKDIVKAGIAANLIPADTLINQQYISAVDSQLLAFNSGG